MQLVIVKLLHIQYPKLEFLHWCRVLNAFGNCTLFLSCFMLGYITGYSRLLWGNTGKAVVTSLVPWATLTSKCVVKAGTISFIWINACDWVRQAVGWPQQGSQGSASSMARCKQGELHIPCPYTDSLHGHWSHEGMVDTKLRQAALPSKPRMDIHKGFHPWVNNRGSEDKDPWALAFDIPRGFRSFFW